MTRSLMAMTLSVSITMYWNYNLDTAKKHFKQTREVVDFYNKAFGFYPFARDGFGLVESPYEGMEHQTAIAYGHGYGKNNSQRLPE